MGERREFPQWSLGQSPSLKRFLARDVIYRPGYISRLCYDVSVRLSVTEVHWRIIANLGFKFRFQFTAHCGRGLAVHAGAGKGSSPGRVEGSSRAMLATARLSCSVI